MRNGACPWRGCPQLFIVLKISSPLGQELRQPFLTFGLLCNTQTMKDPAQLGKSNTFFLSHSSPHLTLWKIHFSSLGIALEELLQPVAMISSIW
jgi:hypothetical protein